MKHVLLAILLVVSACDWQAAENKARCTAGEVTFCTDGGASGGGGGATGGGGGADAGRLDVVMPNGNPFSLEEGPGGMVWVITEQDGWTHVSQFEANVVTLIGAYDAGPAASHADPVVSPALLVATLNGGAGTGLPDGSVGPTIALSRPASVAAQFPTSDGGLTASFWLNSPSQYLQYGSPSPTLMNPTLTTPAVSCSGLEFHDLALLLGDAGCCAVIGYSGSCAGGAGTGIDGGSGVQILAVDRVPFGVKLENVSTKVMVGRSAQGFDTATKALGPIVFRRFDFAASPWREFSVTPVTGPLTLGDVSDGFLSLQAQGSFTVEDAGVNASAQTAFVVEPGTKRVVELGPSQPSRVPVLALPGRVVVLWKRNDGRVVLTQFSR